jgi:hypothetical protein
LQRLSSVKVSASQLPGVIGRNEFTPIESACNKKASPCEAFLLVLGGSKLSKSGISVYGVKPVVQTNCIANKKELFT